MKIFERPLFKFLRKPLVMGNVHDNAPVHTALMVQYFLTNNSIKLGPHPPCSPNLVPLDLNLFPRMKEKLKGKLFSDVDEVKENTLSALSSILPKEFQNCFEQ
ncbi:mariner Mos1 transposase [Trichonephila clavipes]|nr:mariner Mos1 transposase [Trichonephila clavipes]